MRVGVSERKNTEDTMKDSEKKDLMKIDIPARADEAPKHFFEEVQYKPTVRESEVVEPLKVEGQYPFDYPNRHQPIEDMSPSAIKEKVAGTDELYPPDDYPVNMWVKLFRYFKARVNLLLASLSSRVAANELAIQELQENGTGGSGIGEEGSSGSISEIPVVTDQTNGLMIAADKAKLDDYPQKNALDSELAALYVKKAGDTLTGDLIFEHTQANNHAVIVKHKTDVYTQSPPSVLGSYLVFYDKDGVLDGYLGREHLANGRSQLAMWVKGENGKVFEAKIRSDPDGTGAFYIPEYGEESNAYVAATRHWVEQKLGSTASLDALVSFDDEVETFVSRQQKAIAQINDEAQQAIYAGFIYCMTTGNYYISYSLFDQINLQDLAIRAIGNNDFFTINVHTSKDDTISTLVEISVSARTIIAIHKAGLEHKMKILKEANKIKKEIMACKTEEQLKHLLQDSYA